MKNIPILLIFALFFCFWGCDRKDKLEDPSKDPASTPEPEELDPSVEGKPFVVEQLNLKMAWIPPGKYYQGSHKSEFGHQFGEENLHEVLISRGFWMGIHEVTQQQYDDLMRENPSFVKGENLPVNRVTWYMTRKFCEKLTEEESRADRIPKNWKFRLPTEAQWEYACRATTKTAYHFGDEVEELAKYGWYNANSTGAVKPVGLKKPNEWGLYDMHGNVGEWCFDWFGKTYPPDRSVDPVTAKASEFKVFRGGTYADLPERCRSAHRHKTTPATANPWIGFRVVLVPF